MFRSKLCSVLFVYILAVNCITGSTKKTVLCYIQSWAVYRQSQGQYTIADVDANLCTHLVYCFLALNETSNTVASKDSWADFVTNGRGLGQLKDLVKLKDEVPNLKVMISIGGWTEGSIKFSNMAASTVKRIAFVESVFQFLRRNQLDGVEISWLFPTDRGGIAEDKRNFASLLKELRVRLNDDNRILAVQLTGKRYVIDPGYDVRTISQSVDYINVMTYDYNGPWERKTGINAPLISENEFNVEFSIDYLIKKGATPSKILLGIATFGHSYTMKNVPDDGNYLRVASDNGYLSPWTRDKGIIGYNEICYELSTTSGWKEMWDDASSTPYAVNHKKFVSYDNQRSILEKVKLVNSKGLGGAMVWSLDTDDFQGLCQGEKYPLVTAVRDHLNKDRPITISNVTIVSHQYG
uniref:Putative catalytically inactive chitinase-like lectin n=1 Tax=Panstrongylus lignarius TaxID=156445 RepID=A0A224XR36_9HEMI